MFLSKKLVFSEHEAKAECRHGRPQRGDTQLGCQVIILTKSQVIILTKSQVIILTKSQVIILKITIRGTMVRSAVMLGPNISRKNYIFVFVILFRAEDSRIMADMKSMKKWCSQLYDINKVESNPGTVGKSGNLGTWFHPFFGRNSEKNTQKSEFLERRNYGFGKKLNFWLHKIRKFSQRSSVK